MTGAGNKKYIRIGSRALVFIILSLCLLSSWGARPVYAVEPNEILKDAALEKRARAISAQLRCLVCQNQSIDDSNAPLAHDLRVLVRERLTSGDSDDAVFAYVVARYGAYVLLKPPFNAYTLLLWLTPFLVLTGASLLLYRSYKNRAAPRSVADIDGLSADEQAELDALLAPPSNNEHDHIA